MGSGSGMQRGRGPGNNAHTPVRLERPRSSAFGQQTHRSHSKWTALASRSPIGSGHMWTPHWPPPLLAQATLGNGGGLHRGSIGRCTASKRTHLPGTPSWGAGNGSGGPMERGGGDLHQVLGPSPQPWSTCTLEASNSPGVHCSLVGPAHPCGSRTPEAPLLSDLLDLPSALPLASRLRKHHGVWS